MVMFKTSKPWLTEKQHLHSDKMEQMSSLESVKVRHRRGNVICLSVDFRGEFPKIKLMYTDVAW